MSYQLIALDLDGTLTNSKKLISGATKNGILEIQKNGKIVVLASGRPVNGVAPLADELQLGRYNGYTLAFNGGRITDCASGEVIYNQPLPSDVIAPIWKYIKTIPGLDLITYNDTQILSGIRPNQYDEIESVNCRMKIISVDDFPRAVSFPVNKLLVSGDPQIISSIVDPLRNAYRDRLDIYLSEPFFLEIMPLHIDKAYTLQILLDHIGLTADEMICCGDGYNDLSMIRMAGLGVAMGNAQPEVKKQADFITRSNDEDGVLHVINLYMR